MRTMLSLHSWLLGGVVGYLLGSIPSAYLITKWKTGGDLRALGSRNIGARNAFEVTGNRAIGALTLAADLLKGLLPVLVFEWQGLAMALLILLPALVLGHCYPVWLSFHGGRGLATTAGALAAVSPFAVLVWLVVYGICMRLRSHVHLAAAIASVGALALLLLLPQSFIAMTTPAFTSLRAHIGPLRGSIATVVAIILTRHLGPVLAMRREDG